MKGYRYRFENVLSVREMEKSETEIEYQTATTDFERVATELYDLLRKKEQTIEEQQTHMMKGATIIDINHYMHFIDSLEKKIEKVQQEVIRARSKMQWLEQKLLERTLEVRKFEKMKEKDREKFKKEAEQIEAKQLDELSMTTFLGKENGW